MHDWDLFFFLLYITFTSLVDPPPLSSMFLPLSILLPFIPYLLTINQFEGKFLICFDNLANRSYGYELDDKRFSSGSRRICTASIEKLNGEWKNLRVRSAISHTNASLSSCSPSLILFSCSTHDCNRGWNSLPTLLSLCQNVNSSITSSASPLYPHYERSIECFNSTLNKSERIYNLDPRKAEVCTAEASFHNERWTFSAGPRTIWRSHLSSINRCGSTFLRLVCPHSNCNIDITSSPSLIQRCSHSPYPHTDSSSTSCPDCSPSIDESLPLSQQILPPLIHNGSDWIWKEGGGKRKISPPSIRFSIEGGDGRTRKPSLQTGWSREGRLTTTPSQREPLFIYRPEKSKQESLSVGGDGANHQSTKEEESKESAFGEKWKEKEGLEDEVISTPTVVWKNQRKGETINEEESDTYERRRTNISAIIREVWTNESSLHSNGEMKTQDRNEPSSSKSTLKGKNDLPRISAILTPIDTSDRPSSINGEEMRRQEERGNDDDERGEEMMRDEMEEGDEKEEGKSKMTVVRMERREKIERGTIHASPSIQKGVDHRTTRRYTFNDLSSFPDSELIHNLKILRIGIIIGFISITIIIIVFIILLTMLGRRLNSSSSRDNLLPSDPNRDAVMRY